MLQYRNMDKPTRLSPPVLKRLLEILSVSRSGSDGLYPSYSLTSTIKRLSLETEQVRSLAPGELLFRQDEPGDDMYWAGSGAFAILKGELENPRLLAIRHAPDILGEMALLNNAPRSASVAAIASATVGRVDKETFLAFLDKVPGSSLDLMRLLTTRLRESEEKALASVGGEMSDHLTGARSRLALDTLLEESIQRARQGRSVLAVTFLDLDHFKEVNDTLGHGRGDEVLVTFARRIQANLRAEDLFFRYGGDEFALLLPSTDPARAAEVVERLQAAACGMPFPGKPSFFLSFSAGIAYFPFDGETPKELLEIADQRAYQAKWSGGGQVKGEILPPTG